MYWPQQQQQKIIDENMRREEVETAWLEIPGSQIQFQSTKTNIKMYMTSVIMANKGKITGTIYEYKPMFNIFMYTAEQKKLNIHLNQSHCGLFAALLDMLQQPSTINAIFTKSVSMGWIVKPDYNDKVIISKVFSHSLSVDISPTTDERKLQAFKFTWRKNDTAVSVILTTGEVKYFIQLLYAFVGHAPLYVSMYEMKCLSATVSLELGKIERIQQMQIHTAEIMNGMKTSFDMFESKIMKEFSTAVASAVATVSAMSRITQQPTMSMPEPKEEASKIEPLVESTPDDEDFSEVSVVEDIIDGQITDMKLEFSSLVIPEINPDDDAEAGEESYFVDPTKLIHTDLQMMEGVPSLQALLKPGLLCDDVEEQPKILSLADIEKQDQDMFKKSSEDPFAIRVGKQYGVVFKDTEAEIDGYKQLPLNTIYPDEAIDMITPEVCKASNIVTQMPDDKRTYVKSFDIDEWLALLKRKRPNVKLDEDSILPLMIESSFFHKANLSGMLINRGRTGIPATSCLHVISSFASAYEQIDNLPPEKATHVEKLRIAAASGFDVLNCLVEHVDTDAIKQPKALYTKYFKALTKTLIGKETLFSREVFALDKMLLGEGYEYSFFDMKLNLSRKEQEYLMRGMMDAYLLVWYTRREHILFNSQTTPNTSFYENVNMPMARFIRAMMMNLRHVYGSDRTFFHSVIPNIICFESIVKRFSWDLAFFYDACATVLAWDYLMEKYIRGHEEDVDDLGFIKNTEIYKGLPCDEITQALLKA